VHAIGAGILLCEIQQSSDVTYRVYDWNRPGSDGRPRPLHVDRARDVMDFGAGSSDKVEPRARRIPGGTLEVLIDSGKFRLDRLGVETEVLLDRPGDSFSLLCVLAGEGDVSWDGGSTRLRRGDSLLLPAATTSVSLSSRRELQTAIMSMPSASSSRPRGG
jgi:mannose-6-phosphate isomerase